MFEEMGGGTVELEDEGLDLGYDFVRELDELGLIIETGVG